MKIAISETPVDRDLSNAAEIRSIVGTCAPLIIDGQVILTASRTERGDSDAIVSKDETLARLGRECWGSPRWRAGRADAGFGARALRTQWA